MNTSDAVDMRVAPLTAPRLVKDTMSPPKDERTTNAATLTVPLPMTVGAIVFALSIGGAVWSIKTDVQLMNMRLDFEAKIRASDKANVDQQFKTLEAQIDASGGRNAAMAMSIELQKAKDEIAKLKGR